MNENQLLGKRVLEIRVRLGLTQEELAFRCNMHASHIGFLERGERNPSLETLSRLAEGLEIPLHELLNFGEDVKIIGQDETINRIIAYIKPLSPAARKQLYTIVKAFAQNARRAEKRTE